jgi:uncharacterized protein YecE (DUF72 family)
LAGEDSYYLTGVGDLRIGTSGWNYPRGNGTWNGVFYPPPRERRKDFDELRFYAEHFNTVEVNSTFYGQPRAAVARDWAQRTPSGFEFSVKLYQKFTHPRMFAERLERSLAGTGADDETVAALAQPGTADLDEFKRGVEPLANAGKLGALLAQFPASFRAGSRERDYLVALLTRLKEYRVAVELRHRTWSDALPETLHLLNAHGAAWTQIDEPKFRLSIRQNYLPNVTTFYYLRLHGRNAAAWWRHKASEDRYNYLYSAKELEEFSETAGAARQIVKRTYLYTNNHYSAKSIANAAMIKHQLHEPIEGEYPPEFVERYPELAGIVNVTPARRLV